MTDQNNQNTNNELELSVFFQGFRNFCVNILKLAFQALSFYKKNIVVVLILIVGGGVGGYFMNETFKKNYKNEIIVIPNYGSTEYLYSSIEMLNSKITNKDVGFLDKIKIPNHNSIKEITIEPIKDIYSLATKQKTNIDVFKLLAEKGDITKFTSELNTSQHFKFHKITVYKKGKSINDNAVKALLEYLNNNAYYNEYGKVNIEFAKNKIGKNNEMIAQIDSLLSNFRKNGTVGAKDQGININQNSQLNDLVLTKEALYSDNKKLQLDLIDSEKPIQEVSVINDIIEKKLIASKIISFPLLLLALFSGIFLLQYIYSYLKKTAEA